MRAYQKRPSIRGIERIFGVVHPTLSEWLEKDQKLHRQRSSQKALAMTLLAPEPEEKSELDERWSYVGSKNNPIWMGIVLCRRTRQIVAWMWGDRNTDTCKKLWMHLPQSYKRAFCYSDLLTAYQKALDQKQYQACTKQEGQTNHIERFNLTLRQ